MIDFFLKVQNFNDLKVKTKTPASLFYIYSYFSLLLASPRLGIFTKVRPTHGVPMRDLASRINKHNGRSTGSCRKTFQWIREI